MLYIQTNYDLDFEFVVTESGDYPTPANSRPLNDEIDGRGSFVYFNEASMYQNSETGYDTLTQARADGHSGTTDYGSDAKQAFTHMGRYFDVSQPQ